MLSYNHSFHAGNFADVLKHIVLVEMLEHFIQKDKPFEYIDTHSGSGLYYFNSTDAQKLQEFSNGIEKLNPKDFPELAAYFKVIDSFNKPNITNVYPGSPAFAQCYLRPQDRAWLYELHPSAFSSLTKNMSANKKIRVNCHDGLKGLNAVLPPSSRRALILIDPSYELKDEYSQVVDSVINAHKKFSQGMYAIWYPVVERQRIDQMEKKLVKSGIKNIQRFELGLQADTTERGMTSSGLFIINPPWKLFEKMSLLLPKLTQALSDNQGVFKCEVITDE